MHCRIGGPSIAIPTPHVAWVGAPPPLAKSEFAALANGDAELRRGLETLHDLFAQAPLLGSLIQPVGGDLLDPIPKVSRAIFTDHFGLVSDVLAECFSRLRSQSRSGVMQGRVHLGGALSGRDTNAVNKTVSGLIKLLHPSPEMPVSDEDLEWAVRLALEVRRRVKEQQKRIASAEFRNTRFSYVMGLDGVESSSPHPSCKARIALALTHCRPVRFGPLAQVDRTRRSACFASK